MSIESFLRYLELEKRYSPHTVTAYREDLERFESYLREAYGDSAQEAKHPMIRSWMVQLMEGGDTARTINRRLSCLRTYYKYLTRQGLLSQNPMLKVQPPKNIKKLPVFVEPEKMEKLFGEVTFEDNYEGRRDRLILTLFYATGMRLSELCGLKPEDVDTVACQLKVLGKRNKERIIPFPVPIAGMITEYTEVRAREITEFNDDYFFVTIKGRKLYPKLVYNIVVNNLAKVTTAEKKSPHVLRHTFATHMLNNGADINAIKELLGHANLSATQVYTHNTIEKLKNIHTQAHPKA